MSARLRPREVVSAARESASDFVKDDAPAHAAAVAFYLVLSLAPLLLVAVGIAGALAGRERIQQELVTQFGGLVGEEGGRLVARLLEHRGGESKGPAAAIAGVAVLVAGASGAFAQLKAALNRIWEVQVAPTPGPWYGAVIRFIMGRLLSFAMVLVIAFLLLASLVVSAALAGLGTWTSGLLPLPALAMQAINFIASAGLIAVLFALMFKILPDAEVGWREVWLGALITSLLFSVGKHLIGLYLGRSGVASPYGAAGSVILILLWLYYSALIVLLGAEITQVTARRLGKAIRPAPGYISAPEPGGPVRPS